MPGPGEALVQQGLQLQLLSGQKSQMAEMGAQRLESLGPEGQQWAQRLRENPAAALAMAEQYGGMANIESQIRFGQAAGRAATAEDLVRSGAQIYGPQAAQQLGSGLMNARKADVSSGGAVDSDMTLKLRKELTVASEPFLVKRQYYESAVTAAEKAAESGKKEDVGSADFALIQAMGKLIDPNSVVKNEEGNLIMKAGTSAFAEFLFNAQRWFGKTGILDPNARLNLLRQIDAQFQAARGQQKQLVDLKLQEMAGFPGATPFLVDLAVPNELDPELLDMSEFEFGYWEELAGRDAIKRQYEAAKIGEYIPDGEGGFIKKTREGPVNVDANGKPY